MKLNRGDIVIANLESVSKGSIQKYTRPYIIISNNKANQYSPVVTAVAMSTKTWKKKYLPTHCPIPAAKVKVTDTDFEVFDSMALCEQIVSIDVNVQKIKIDKNQPQSKRQAQFLKQVGNPYMLRRGSMMIKVSFANNGLSMEQAFENLLLNV